MRNNLNHDLRMADQVLIQDGGILGKIHPTPVQFAPPNHLTVMSEQTDSAILKSNPSTITATKQMTKVETPELNLSEDKLANIKSPVYLKLENMIQTLDMFRNNMDGKRIPKFEQAFKDRKKLEAEMRKAH